MTPDPPPERFVLDLVALPDPHAGHGVPARSADYRLRLSLKVLLRGFGLKCARVRPAPPTPVQPETDHAPSPPRTSP